MESPEAAFAAAPKHRIFKDRPSQVFIDSVKTHIAHTGQPETYEGLFHGPLAKNEPFIILAPIEVNTRARPAGDWAPCPMCHANNKFKEGRLVYLPERSVAAVIGHECAAHETNKEADREWRLRENRRQEEDYLLRILPQSSRRFTEVGKAMATCQEAEIFLRRFRSEGKPFFEAIRKTSAAGGQLVVTEEIKSSGAGPRGIRTTGSSIETRDHMIGILRGRTAVSANFKPKTSAELILEAINRHIYSNEEDAIDYISGLSDLERTAVVKEQKKAEQDFLSLIKKLQDLVFFFGDQNLATINEWANHRFSSFKFEVKLGQKQLDGRRRFEARTNSLYFHRLISPALWENLSSLSIADKE